MEPATLTDSLLGDLDDLSDAEEEEREEENFVTTDMPADDSNMDFNIETNEPSTQQLLERVDGNHTSSDYPPIGHSMTRKRFLEDPSLLSHVAAVRRIAALEESAADAAKRSDTLEEQQNTHSLIVTSNKHLSALAIELSKSHQLLSTAYGAKFPELEELLPDYRQYRNAVKVIANNDMDMTKLNHALNQFLNSNQIITISVAASTTAGRLLTPQEMQTVRDAGHYMDRVMAVHTELTTFVQERMEGLAPSMCALVGAKVAARLLGLAGGLAEFSKIPACNLQVLGQVRHNATSRGGMASSHSKPHQGILAECDLVMNCPGYLQRRALKAVAGKLALIARFDYINVQSGRKRSAESGKMMREQILEKIGKWEEPDRAQVVKALPKNIAATVIFDMI